MEKQCVGILSSYPDVNFYLKKKNKQKNPVLYLVLYLISVIVKIGRTKIVLGRIYTCLSNAYTDIFKSFFLVDLLPEDLNRIER